MDGRGEGKSKHVVGGFDALKALRDRELDSQPQGASASPSASVNPVASGSPRIRAAAQPHRTKILCYECAYEFVHTGILERVLCAKCRTTLDTGDHEIATEWNDELRTIGSVTLAEGASVTGGLIRANVIVLAGGVVSAGDLTALVELRIAVSGDLDAGEIQADRLKIMPEADVVFPDGVCYTGVCVAGKARGTLKTSGCLTIQAGGCVEGYIETERLVIEDGGGLIGDVKTGPGTFRGAGD